MIFQQNILKTIQKTIMLRSIVTKSTIVGLKAGSGISFSGHDGMVN